MDDKFMEILRKEPEATFADGLAQQRVLDAARRSHANGGRWEAVR